MIEPALWPETKQAIDIARKAGEAVIQVYHKELAKKEIAHSFKKDKEPVTEADMKSNKIIQEGLANSEYVVLSEESDDDKRRLQEKKVWIVDPLDGTSDFINKSEDFSIMIGLVENQVPIMGVVYQPTKDRLYVGQKGMGSYVQTNGKWTRIQVTAQPQLHEFTTILSRHHLSHVEKEFLDALKISQFKQMGSAGLKIAEICKGDAELYLTTTDKIKEWDTCAAYCILEEAGGHMTDMLGKPLLYNKERVNHDNGILVSNGQCHEEIVRGYQSFVQERTDNKS